jgi:hypothetical protein
MARRKKIENETEEQCQTRRILEYISNLSNRSEKVSWNRKMDNMVKLISDLNPIEQQIIKLMNDKIPIYDNIQQLRNEMTNECIHPYEYLVYNQDHIICKFCNKKISIPTDKV